jgi:hypothetical protein
MAMRLNLGSGGGRFPGFLNVDFDPLTKPDLCFDIEKAPWPIDDSSVDQVIAHHVLEHLGEGYYTCLQELYRVCMNGALIDVRVPHPRHDHFLNDPTHRRPITVDGLKLFDKKYNDSCREQGLRTSLLGYHYRVDFEVLNHRQIQNSYFKEELAGKSEAEIDRMAAKYNNIYLETHMTLRVNK